MAGLQTTRSKNTMNNLSRWGLFWSVGRRFLVAGAVLALVGCATSGNPRDPLEPINRAVFSFNDGFDKAIAKPLAEGYRAVVPSFARTGATNFFSNLEDLWIAVNDLIQGKPRMALDDWTRAFLNTTIGVFGLFDVASDLGLEKRNEDFGQTLGRWGVGSGPYLVLPFLGSSTLRDALSRGFVDSKADLVVQHHYVPERNSLFFLRTVNLRANLLEASRIVEEAALDKYTFTRDAYLQHRQNLVYDGNPPKDERAASDDVEDGEAPTAELPSAADAGSSGVEPRLTAPLAGLPIPAQQN